MNDVRPGLHGPGRPVPRRQAPSRSGIRYGAPSLDTHRVDRLVAPPSTEREIVDHARIRRARRHLRDDIRGLMLSACGGSPSTAPTSTSPSAPAAVTAGRPTITFPADAKDVFEDQHTGDTTKETILADKVKWIESLDDAIFRGTTGTQALGFYATGMGLDKSVTYAQGFLSKKYTWQGTVRFFDRKVTLLSSGTAAVIHCSDESKGFLKDRTETVWGEASPSEEWKNGQRDRYVNGKPYTNFNLDKAGRGYFWSGYTPASNYGKPDADSCTDEP